MMRVIRSTSRLVLMLGMLILAVVPARAQETPGLSADDAALWQSALNATFAAPQLSYQYDFELDLDGLQTAALGARLSGQGVIDSSGEMPSVAFESAGDVRVGSSYTFPVDFQVRRIGNQIYLNSAGAQTPQWQTMPFADTHVTFSGGWIDAPSNAVPMSFNPEVNTFMDGFYKGIPDLAKLTPIAFATVTRRSDVDGLADFHSNVDLPTLAVAAELVNTLRNFSLTEGVIQVRYKAADWTAFVQGLAGAVANTTFTVDAYVDIASRTIRRLVIDGNVSLDPAAMAIADGPLTGTLHLDVRFDGVGEPQAIAIPDGAESVDTLAFPVGSEPSELQPDAGEQLIMRIGVLKEGESLTVPVDVKAGQKLTVSARGMGLNFDTILTLLSPTGEELISNDNVEEPVFLIWMYNAEIRDYEIPADGTYQIQTHEYEYNAGALLLSIYVTAS